MKLTYIFLLISVTIYALAVAKKDSSARIKENPYTQNSIITVDPDTEISGRSENGNFSSSQNQNNPPKVEILMPDNKGVFSWSTQVRYSISVSDLKDGESKYGEINANEVLLEIEYFPLNKEQEIKERLNKSQTKQEPKGLSLIKTSTCFGCHADKTRLAGPSFSEIAEKYKPTASTIKNLGSHIIGGSSGIWGSLEMPTHPDFTQEGAAQIATFILEQGGNKNRWVYPGLEGTFWIMEKPENDSQGIYVLTASYTSHAHIRGQHSIVLKIK